MKRESLENRIKHYFIQEAAEGDLSPQQWQEVLSHVRRQKQMRWPWGSTILAMPRPLMAMAVSLLLVVVVGGVSLWAVAPWREAAPGVPLPQMQPEPRGILGPAGRPAPLILEATWAIDRNTITPGEALNIKGTLKNVWDQRIDVTAFPETVTLTLLDTRDVVMVPLTVPLGIPVSIEPGQEVTFVAHVSTDVSARLQPGRYNVGIEIAFAHTPGKPQYGTTKLGMGGGPFVVLPPQGALNKTVEVGEAREANGVWVTLESIQFTPGQTTIVASAVLPVRTPTRPTTAPPSPKDATPTPVPTPTPAGRQHSGNPWYRIDGGDWRELTSFGYRETPEGLYLQWTLGPVPADAKTFDFSIGKLGSFVFGPGLELIGPWEWSVPLQ